MTLATIVAVTSIRIEPNTYDVEYRLKILFQFWTIPWWLKICWHFDYQKNNFKTFNNCINYNSNWLVKQTPNYKVWLPHNLIQQRFKSPWNIPFFRIPFLKINFSAAQRRARKYSSALTVETRQTQCVIFMACYYWHAPKASIYLFSVFFFLNFHFFLTITPKYHIHVLLMIFDENFLISHVKTLKNKDTSINLKIFECK